MVLPSAIIEMIGEADTIIVNCQLSIVNSQGFSVAGVQDFFDHLAVGAEVFEIAHYFPDRVHDGESVGIAAADGGKGRGLVFVDHADQHIGLMARIHALGGDQGGGMVQLFDDLVGDFLGMVRDDLEADGLPAGFHQPVANGS